MKKIDDYKVGDELFRYIEMGGIHRYIVQGVRQYQDDVQLEVEDQSCSHGWKCRLLVARNDYGKLHAVHMLNDDEEDTQRHWHQNEGFHFWPTTTRAKAEGFDAAIRRAKESVAKAEDGLAAAKRRLQELESLRGSIVEPTP